jgi:hypothetical protein
MSKPETGLRNSRSPRDSRCSKNVVVVGSERVKSVIEGSNPDRCNCLRNLVLSTIFRTGQKSRQVYESAALTAELQAHGG